MEMQFDKMKEIWEYNTGLLNNHAGVKYENLSPDDQVKAKANAEEHLLTYIFIQNSGSQHDLFKCELQNNYTKGNDQYPKTHSAALMFLDRYSKSTPPVAISEGTYFTQRGKSCKKKKAGGDKDKDP